MVLDAFLSSPVMNRLGWTVIHSLWQGLVVALLLGVVLVALRQRSSSCRYQVAWVGLLVMIAVCMGTYWWLGERSVVGPSGQYESGGGGMRGGGGLVFVGPVRDTTLNIPADLPSPAPAPAPSLASQAADLVPSVAGVWMVGVLLLGVWRVTAYFRVQGLRHGGREISNPRWAQVLSRLRAELHVRPVVSVIESAVVKVPAVVGHFRPVILVPISMVSGLSPAEIEAVLAHELAHIRRRDYLANLLQTLLETVLFYHPAVWWISSVIRRERENCCDDIAAAACGDVHDYVSALARVEVLRGREQLPLGAMAMTGRGGLVGRVKRLLERKETPMKRRAMSIPMVLALIGLAAGPVVYGQLKSDKPSPPNPPTPSQATTPAVPSLTAADRTANVDVLEVAPTPVTPADLVPPVGEDYRIVEGDTLKVVIGDLAGPGQETMRTLKVTEPGAISLPLLDAPVPAVGLTTRELQSKIVSAYESAQMLANGKVDVLLVEPRGKMVTILGAVKTPGEYQLVKAGTRMTDALALVQGLLPAAGEDALIVRETKEGPRKIAVPIRRLLAGEMKYDVVLRPGDKILVQEGRPMTVSVPAPALPPIPSEPVMKEDAEITGVLNTVMHDVKKTNAKLSEVLDQMRAETGANIWVNWNQLDSLGVTADTNISHSPLKNVTLRTYLNLVTRSMGPGINVRWGTEGNVIVIGKE